MKNSIRTYWFVFLLLIPVLSWSQNLLIDQGIKAGDLWCFPILNKQNVYRYLPLNAQITYRQDSIPEFSYMRYIVQRPANSDKTLDQADGGGILHFLIQYNTPEKKISTAQNYLRKQFNNDSISLIGPVVFSKARYTLVSSILDKKDKNIIGSGEAPILENSKLALSFSVDPVKSKLLLESFKMPTPDVSIVFELEFSGLTDSYQASLDIDWSEVNTSQEFNAGGSVYYIGADIGLGFDRLTRNNAIQFNSTGSDVSLENLVQRVYDKLLELMFKKVPLEKVPNKEKGGIEEALGALLSSNGALGSRKTTGFGLNVAYQYQEHKSSVKSHLVFTGRSSINRTHFITFNIGDLYKKYGKNEQVFKDVPLWDPAFQQRDVYIGIDGEVEREFNKMINSVTIKILKKHQDSSQTMNEVLITKNRLQRDLSGLSVSYLNHKDSIRTKWLEYEYQTIWKFIGGTTFQSDWKKESGAMINLYIPYERKKIDILGDTESLKKKNIRAVSVVISYDFFGNKKTERRIIYPNKEKNNDFFEITLPAGQQEINYTITWFNKNGESKQKSGIDPYGLLFIDEIP